MPPWSADPKGSVAFKNDPTLTKAEIDTVVAWVDLDAPSGSEAEPPAPVFVDGWNDPSGRNPDYVLTLPGNYSVPASAEGSGASRLNPVFYVKVPFDTDRWFRAVHARRDPPHGYNRRRWRSSRGTSARSSATRHSRRRSENGYRKERRRRKPGPHSRPGARHQGCRPDATVVASAARPRVSGAAYRRSSVSAISSGGMSFQPTATTMY